MSYQLILVERPVEGEITKDIGENVFLADLHLGRLDEAIRCYDRAIELNYRNEILVSHVDRSSARDDRCFKIIVFREPDSSGVTCSAIRRAITGA